LILIIPAFCRLPLNTRMIAPIRQSRTNLDTTYFYYGNGVSLIQGLYVLVDGELVIGTFFHVIADHALLDLRLTGGTNYLIDVIIVPHQSILLNKISIN
jgi:hypothetical protein